MKQSKIDLRNGDLNFLAGGGEMGERIRAFDWSRTSIGPPAQWPQSLKIAVRIMLTSRQAFWIGWGEEVLYIYNDPYKSILGGKHPWALGEPAHRVCQEFWDDISGMLSRAMRGDEGTYIEAQRLIMERHGYPEETYYTYSFSPIPDDDGGVGGIICANTDDTRTVIGERQLALLRELSARTADARSWQEACDHGVQALATNQLDLPFAMIYIVDPASGEFSLAGASGIERGHQAAPKIVGDADSRWPLDQVLRTRALAIVSDLQTRFIQELPTGGWNRPPRQAAVLPIAPSGETGRAGALVVGLSPFRLFDDQYRGFITLTAGQLAAGIANAQAYEEERRRAQALAELDRAKTTFFSNVSHEFRTPLTLLLGPLEDTLAKSDDLPAHHHERLEIAHRNSLRLLKLVNTLLDFSRIEAGRIQAVYQPTDLGAYTAELASVFRSAIEKAGLHLIIDCRSPSESVYVDREMWEKIVLNLLSNAFKFTFKGEISVSLRQAGEMVELAVKDTGTGIPAGEVPHLFERFHQVKGARGRSLEGSGIGLALVQELVKLHGGAMRVVSNVDHGSTFTVVVPLGAAHLPADRVGTARPLTSTELRGQVYVEEALRWLPETQNAEPGMRKGQQLADGADTVPQLAPLAYGDSLPRILLADDNADMRDYVRRLLSGRYQVEAVTDGLEALNAARERTPDLVLTDIMMPRLDGVGLLKELRADERLKTVPVILLSARAGEEASVEGIERGADDYLTKPFSARELVARVDTHLKMARLRTEGEKALRESEERMRLAIRATRMVSWEWIPSQDSITTSDSFADLYGLTALAGAEEGFALVLPEDKEAHIAKVRKIAAEGGSYDSEFRIKRRDNGRIVWLEERAEAQVGPDGMVERVMGVTLDITHRKRAEERQRLLIGELNHRVKNTLATVQAIANQTLRSAPDPAEFSVRFGERLQALSNAHNLLTRTTWQGADVGDIVRDQLTLEADETRISAAGPRAILDAQSSLALALVLHELGTNARKYGALSTSQGRLTIRWDNSTETGEARLKLDWTEKGGPPVQAPAKKGFGTALVNLSLRSVGGKTDLRFEPEGVRCWIELPLGCGPGEGLSRKENTFADGETYPGH